MSETTTCHRCKRAVPDLLPHDWEVIEDEDGQPREVCGDCITPSEQQAIGEETIDFAEKMRGHDRSTSHPAPVDDVELILTAREQTHGQ